MLINELSIKWFGIVYIREGSNGECYYEEGEDE